MLILRPSAVLGSSSGNWHAHERVVRDGDPGGLGRVARLEVASPPHRDAEGVEIARTDHVPAGHVAADGRESAALVADALGGAGPALHVDAGGPPGAAQDGHARHRGRSHSRDRLHALGDRAIERAALLARVAQQVDRKLRGDEPLHVEARADALDLAQVAQEEAGGDEQHQGQRDLGDDEGAAEVEAPRARVRHERLVLEHGHEIEPGGGERRGETESDAGESGQHEREREHAEVDRQLEGERQGTRRRGQGAEGGDDGEGQGQAGRAPEQREEHALGEELRDEPPPAGAQREAHRDLAPPRGCAGQHQVGHVRAGEEQHRPHHRHQQRGHRGQARPHLAVTGVDGHRDRDARPRSCRGRRRDGGGQHGQRGGRLGGGGPRLEPPQAEEPAVGAPAKEIGIHLPGIAGARGPHDRLHHHGHVEVPERSPLRAVEPFRGHADDGEAVAVEEDIPPHDPRLAVEPPPPQAVADHGHGVRPRRDVVARGEEAAKRRPHAEHVEVVAGGDDADDELGLAGRIHAGHDPAPGGQPALERAAAVAQLGVLGIRQDAAPVPGDLDEALRLADRERPEERGAHQAEDGGIRPDAEGEREDGGGGEPRVVPERARPVAQVARQAGEDAPRPAGLRAERDRLRRA